MVSRKQAPRREVIQIERRGDWGDVRYVHQLSCGHSDVRKRPAPAPHISCLACLHERERPAPEGGQPLSLLEFDRNDRFAEIEADVSALRARVAARFQIPHDAINVHTDSTGRALWVGIVLTAEEASRI